MKYLILISCLLLGVNTYSQALKVIETDSLSEVELENLDSLVDKEGWVLIKFEGESSINNFSNKEYILTILMNCSETSYTPRYLIEYSKYYDDGTYDGIDFVNSVTANQKFAQIKFLIDKEDFGNPFLEFEKEGFSIFHQALKSGELLTITFFRMEYNSETGDYDKLSLDRSIDFKLGNSEFLDIPVNCNVFSESTAPSEEALPAE